MSPLKGKLAICTALAWLMLGGLLASPADSAAADQTNLDSLPGPLQAAGGERISVNFRDSPIQQVFEVLSRKDKLNIILAKEVTGTVSVNLYGVTIDEAIHRVAETAGYAVEIRNGDYMILDRKEAGLDRLGGMKVLRTFKVQYSDPRQVAEILTKYLSRYGKITPLNDRRLIVIEDTPEFLERAKLLLEQLDVQPRQILIEAKILEVSLDDGERYGVDWGNIFGTPGDPSSNSGKFGVNGLSQGSVAGGPRMSGFFFSLTNRRLDLFLEAQESKGRIHTISAPKLLAMENQEAKAVIGDSTGYKVTTTINQVTTETVQFLESGVILKVIPSVDQQGRVLLKIHPEVSSTVLANGIPSKKSTEFTTELLCEDGQSVFIGGLIKKRSSENRVGIPVLGSIPVLGALFSTNAAAVSTVETVVIITPHVINDSRATARLSSVEIGQIERASSLIQNHQNKLEPESRQSGSGGSGK